MEWIIMDFCSDFQTRNISYLILALTTTPQRKNTYCTPSYCKLWQYIYNNITLISLIHLSIFKYLDSWVFKLLKMFCLVTYLLNEFLNTLHNMFVELEINIYNLFNRFIYSFIKQIYIAFQLTYRLLWAACNVYTGSIIYHLLSCFSNFLINVLYLI